MPSVRGLDNGFVSPVYRQEMKVKLKGSGGKLKLEERDGVIVCWIQVAEQRSWSASQGVDTTSMTAQAFTRWGSLKMQVEYVFDHQKTFIPLWAKYMFSQTNQPVTRERRGFQRFFSLVGLFVETYTQIDKRFHEHEPLFSGGRHDPLHPLSLTFSTENSQ